MLGLPNLGAKSRERWGIRIDDLSRFLSYSVTVLRMDTFPNWSQLCQGIVTLFAQDGSKVIGQDVICGSTSPYTIKTQQNNKLETFFEISNIF